ncbi:hypothetical protein U9M48_041053 [Paspalum notatum var. saurae]|uniref:Uncharacterized protein n=1 Tax=Paspalum notatum var. saurae TaxID=547442 RepID=A0AAQ3XDT6_PASNO
MGRRRRRRAQQRPQPPAVEYDDTDVARNSILKEENAVELWLKQFLEFEDKSVAINRTTGLDKQLRDMLKIWTRPGETLVVGSLDHQEIIEADVELGVKCWYDACVMEMMWGMKNLMRSLVPQEQKVLTKEERLPLSKGLQMILHRYNFDVKPEMVNDDIVETACFLYDCDLMEKKISRSLHMSDSLFMDISELNSEDWSAMKLAIAHVKIAYPEMQIRGDHATMFSSEELLKIEKHREIYNEKFITCSILDFYDELQLAYKVKEEKLAHMKYLVGVAQGAAKRVDQAVV